MAPAAERPAGRAKVAAPGAAGIRPAVACTAAGSFMAPAAERPAGRAKVAASGVAGIRPAVACTAAGSLVALPPHHAAEGGDHIEKRSGLRVEFLGGGGALLGGGG
jgi:hypothetical protein